MQEENPKDLHNLSTKEVLGERVRPAIRAFFAEIKPQQWQTLKSGDPDFATRYVLAEFIVELIDIVAKQILSKVQSESNAVSEANVFSDMRNVLPQTFAEALQLDAVAHTASIDSFAKLMAKEVTLNVQSEMSSYSSSGSSSEGLCCRVVPPKKLSNMITHASRMIKSFIRKVDYLSRCRLVCQESDDYSVEIKLVQGEELAGDKTSVEMHVEEEHETDARGSQDSLNAAAVEAVQYAIKKATTELTKSLLDQEPQYEKVHSDTIKESEKVSEEIADFLEEEIQHDKHFKTLLQEVGIKVQTFFAKQFAKVTILRSAAKLRAKFWGKNRTDSRESVEKLVESVDSLLQSEKNQFRALETLRTVSLGTSLWFTEKLRDLLFHHASDSDQPPSEMWKKICAVDVRSRVTNIFAMLRWWLNTQMELFTQRVTDLLSAIRPRKQPAEGVSGPDVNVRKIYVKSMKPAEGGSAPDFDEPAIHDKSIEPEEGVSGPDFFLRRSRDPSMQPAEGVSIEDPVLCQAHIALVLHKLIARITKKANIHCMYFSAKYLDRLLEQVWAKIQNTEDITSEKLKNIEKSVLEDLCDYFGSVDECLALMIIEEMTIMRIVASSLVHHLAKPKNSAIARFFYTVGKAITKCSRRA